MTYLSFCLFPSTRFKPSNNCCGNSVCDAFEDQCNDCGPFSLAVSFERVHLCAAYTDNTFDLTHLTLIPFQFQTPDCSSCFSSNGMMFDVLAGSSASLIDGLAFKHNHDAATVTIYTSSGSYKDSYSISGLWTQIASTSIVPICESLGEIVCR